MTQFHPLAIITELPESIGPSEQEFTLPPFWPFLFLHAEKALIFIARYLDEDKRYFTFEVDFRKPQTIIFHGRTIRFLIKRFLLGEKWPWKSHVFAKFAINFPTVDDVIMTSYLGQNFFKHSLSHTKNDYLSLCNLKKLCIYYGSWDIRVAKWYNNYHSIYYYP